MNGSNELFKVIIKRKIKRDKKKIINLILLFFP